MLLDEHSRLVLHGRWVAQENTRAGQQVVREAVLAYGLPEILYSDNGAPYTNAALERTCAVLGIRLIHSRPVVGVGVGKEGGADAIVVFVQRYRRNRPLPTSSGCPHASRDSRWSSAPQDR